ncbi:MAG: aminopeptidase [Candidatus Lokiarchaeota archaeon]|nr:aminopeptidase [Candidatus Lokiarchaeota archaeon]
MDPRIEKHAKILVEWSTEVKKGDMVLVRATPNSHDLAVAIVHEVAKIGGNTVVLMDSEEMSYAYFKGAEEDTLKQVSKHVKALYENTDVIIALRSPMNTRATSNIDPKKMITRSIASQPISEIMMSKRWCLTVHPCATLAQQGNMSMDEYQEFVYNSMFIDWKEESKNMHLIKEHLEKHDDVRFVGPETDLYAKTKGRIWIASDGKRNMPSGEVFTAPIEDTVEGKIYFDIPFMQQGKVIEGVRLTFEKGEVVDYSVEKNEEAFKAVLETDEGSRYLGEMAIGTNRGIKDYTLNMLFDEKIGDTIHCALGRAYKECNGVNESAIHVDMIKTMIEGEITAGDETIYSKGKFFFE